MQLSKRLQAVADLVTPGSRVADIGCDHAHVSIYLVENKISPRVIAMDINQGPIERAAENINKYGFSNLIEVRKSAGLERLGNDEADTILIAGMGGRLMVNILSDHIELVKKVSELILQPQSEIHLVRQFIDRIGYSIIEENMIKEDGKYYVMMKAERSSLLKQKELYDLIKKEHYYYGRRLLEEKHPILLEFLKKEHKKCEEIYEVLVSGQSERSLQRLMEIREKLQIINRGLEYFEPSEL